MAVNELLVGGELPESRESRMVSLFKEKGKAIECGNYQTIDGALNEASEESTGAQA